MEVIYKKVMVEDWITVLLFLCFLIASLAEYFSRKGYLRSWISYAPSMGNYEEKLEQQQFSLSILFRLMVFTLLFAFVTLKYKNYAHNQPLDVVAYLTLFVVLLTFFLSKYYLAKILALALKKEAVHQMFQNLKYYHNGLLGYFILGITIIHHYNINYLSAHSLLLISFLSVIFNTLIVLYRARSIILRFPLIFIAYLCALEIAPYLLLYKYFIA